MSNLQMIQDAPRSERILSDLSQAVVVDGHRVEVEIYRVSGDPYWLLAVTNAFGTSTTFDAPAYRSEAAAWQAFEGLVGKSGVPAFYTADERGKLGLSSRM